MAYHSGKKKMKKKSVKAGYGSMSSKRVMASKKGKAKKMKGLTPAQKKLPMALQKAILKKKKK